MHDDIRTEARRLGELEAAFLRQANEGAALKRECARLNCELMDMAWRVDALEVLVAFADDRPWYRRLLWFT